jgi:hypothetical protein
MSEKQIREILKDVCADLEQHSRRVVRSGVRKVVLPTVLGAGLALGGCDLGSESDYGAPMPDGYYKEAGVDKGKSDGIVGKDVAVYSAPDAIYAAPMDGQADTKKKPDNGAQPDYMAPDGGK